jgi:hypothetical protein
MQQDNQGELAEGAFLTNESDMPFYLNQLYDLYIEGHQRGNAYDDVAPTQMKGSAIMMPDLASDNAVAFTGTAGNPSARLDGSYIAPTEGSKTANGWEWSNLKKVNYFLRHYHDADANVVDVNVLDKWAAEAYFFKAWDYYKKLYIFGEVPWYTLDLNVNSEELYAPRTPRAELVDSILWSLNFAVEHIQDSKTATGRINRDQANFLKARFCLFEGTFRKYQSAEVLAGARGTSNAEAAASATAMKQDYKRFLEETVKACEAIIASGHYQLFKAKSGNDSYWQLFSFVQEPAADGNTEAIMARVYDGDKYGHGTSRYYIMNRGNAGGRYSKGATKAFIEDYLCLDGRPIYTGGTEGSYVVNPLFKGYDGMWEELDNRDPRLTQTVEKPGTYLSIFDRDKATLSQAENGLKYPEITYNCPTANQCVTLGPTVTGYAIVKHMTTDLVSNGSTAKGRQTALVFRYGEVLLMLAEAKAELGTLTNDDLDRTINMLRERAGFDFTKYPNSRLHLDNVPTDPRLDKIYAEKLNYSVSPILREIRRERRIEMAQEGLRREDLVRWRAGQLMEVPLRGMKFTAEKQALYDGTHTTKAAFAAKAQLNVDVFVDADGFIIGFPRAPRVTDGTLKWEERYYLWPLPLRELELNKNLIQNPGWQGI